jgi:hypothetical protein
LPQDEKEAEEDLAEMEAMLYCKLHYLEYQVAKGSFHVGFCFIEHDAKFRGVALLHHSHTAVRELG